MSVLACLQVSQWRRVHHRRVTVRGTRPSSRSRVPQEGLQQRERWDTAGVCPRRSISGFLRWTLNKSCVFLFPRVLCEAWCGSDDRQRAVWLHHWSFDYLQQHGSVPGQGLDPSHHWNTVEDRQLVCVYSTCFFLICLLFLLSVTRTVPAYFWSPFAQWLKSGIISYHNHSKAFPPQTETETKTKRQIWPGSVSWPWPYTGSFDFRIVCLFVL